MTLAVLANEALGLVRRVQVNGRGYLVAQATLLVPGVLNGSGGALFYPPQDVATEPGRWNGVPVVVNHPQEGGAYLSARDPEVLARQGVGHLYRARFDGGLKAEAWLDEEALRRVDNALFEAVARGRPVEVSTGLFTDNVPEEGRYEGKPYAYRATNYRPDHLALLPTSTGACSLRDGCGLNVHAEGESFFADCPRDEKGHCEAAGGGAAGGAAGGGGGAAERKAHNKAAHAEAGQALARAWNAWAFQAPVARDHPDWQRVDDALKNTVGSWDTSDHDLHYRLEQTTEALYGLGYLAHAKGGLGPKRRAAVEKILQHVEQAHATLAAAWKRRKAAGGTANAGAKMSWLQKIGRALFLRGLDVEANQLPSEELEITPDKACILPGQILQGRVTACSKAAYAGKAVQIRTASGQTLAVTTNHPVLTVAGFVPAGRLDKGHYLLRYVGEDKAAAADGDEQNAPTLVEDVAEALLASGFSQERSGITRLDFHGDAAFFQGDVQVVRADRPLRLDAIADAPERLHQGRLTGVRERESLLPGGGGPGEGLGSLPGARPGSVGGGRLRFPFLGGRDRITQTLRHRNAPEHPGGPEFSLNDGDAESGFGRDGRGRLAGAIIREDDESSRLGDDDLEGGGAAVETFRGFGPAAELDVSGLEEGPDGLDPFSELAGKLLDGFPGKVLLDEVIHVEVFHYEGPVYDFQSPLGYIVTENLVISNCQIVEDKGPGGTDELSQDQLGTFGAKCGERHEEAKGGGEVNANKAGHVAWLTANCACFRGKDQVLDQFTENELIELVRDHRIALVVNNLGEGAEEERERAAEEERRQRAAEEEKRRREHEPAAAAEAEPGSEKEPELDDETRKRLLALMGEYDQNEMEGARKALAALNRWLRKNQKAAAPATNAADTEAAYLAQAPPRVRGLLQNAFRVQERERGLLVRRLSNNRAAQQRLAQKSYEELVELAELFPPAPAPEDRLPLFLGAGGGPPLDLTANRDEVLDLDAYRKEASGAT